MALTAIFAAKALIGENLAELNDACILVDGAKIKSVMTKAEFQKSNVEADSIDLGGMTVLPGMIECHSHLAIDARVPDHLEFMSKGVCEHTVRAVKCLKDDLMSGVTTMRCLGDRAYIDVELKKMVKDGVVVGPDLLVCGIGMRASHGHGFAGMPHSGVEEFRKTARENMYRGVDVLKIFVTPGAPAVTADDFIPCYMSYDEIRTVVEEASSAGIRTVAHCIGGKGLDYCVKAGVDSIEHLYSITPEQAELVAAEHKGWVDMTSGIVLDPEREPFLSASSAKRFRDARAYSFKCMKPIYNDRRIRWSLGTDANHGLLYKELEFAVSEGASRIDALKGVTVNAAKNCGVERRTGKLEAGMDADMIATPSDPLTTENALRDVKFVMKKGEIFKS